ncbi:Protein-serine/threonine phosphatase protein [Dioscorea alata]|uniref:Protein-serine/threonine phosphatase protein n=3 Tax=Dioscorea alata TaxID=55571 RepID=A0ACB7U806_DIOAL|nr:Protein-serine/threonine phosphatase protein [Dioscorea alata]
MKGLTLLLCGAWAMTLLYGEMVAFLKPLWACSWPPMATTTASSDGLRMNDQVKVAVLADPQLMDRTSLGLPSGSLALEAAQFYTDIYMRRSFHSSVLPFKPDLILFLGDMFDGGPYLSDQEWQESLNRLRHIFKLNDKGRNSYIPVYYLSGNHDIGYSGLYSLYPKVVSRFENEFGARNYRFLVGKVEFIVVDAQTLDGPKDDNQTSLSWNFIRNISKDSSHPRVLLTHIPLYRPDGTPCGSHRSSPVINQRVSFASPGQGITYQNYLTKETSDGLLDAVKPILVLSGHDHDQCTITHSTPFGAVEEHTLGTFSWQQGNLYPSFMLLTATSRSSSIESDSKNAVSTHLCFLPMQTHIYIWYIAQFMITLFLLIVWPRNGFSCLGHYIDIIKGIGRSFFTTSKEKDDEDCEYEMVWDAEGSMHLVKKASNRAQPTKSDLGSTGRGNAVVRPSARKNITPEQDASVFVEMAGDSRSGNTAKTSKFSNSRMKKLIQRVISVFQALVIIAAVNVPLYIMLLFKDWI